MTATMMVVFASCCEKLRGLETPFVCTVQSGYKAI